ncbi:MAG: indole-3-glycerol phosphate synthase TrpC [Terriglobia bacterium]
MEENRLSRIVQVKKAKLETLKKLHPNLEGVSWRRPRHDEIKIRSFYDALDRSERLNVIAEIKKASPSKGILCEDFDPVQIAMDYESNNAAAISILTEEDHFQGSVEHLRGVRQAVSRPILQKDFIVDPWQLYEAAQSGADAILLIVAILEPAQLKDLSELANRLGLDVLVEVHNLTELRIALEAESRIVGVNNRDLKTFRVDISTTIHLAPHVPDSVLLVSESGIQTADDIRMLRDAGVDAFLIGEIFMKSKNPGRALRELMIRSLN